MPDRLKNFWFNRAAVIVLQADLANPLRGADQPEVAKIPNASVFVYVVKAREYRRNRRRPVAGLREKFVDLSHSHVRSRPRETADCSVAPNVLAEVGDA